MTAAPDSVNPLVEVDDLRVKFVSRESTVRAVNGVSFALMPGDRFSESELAQGVAVSRTPLRQALQRLVREGFLRVMPKIGWQVAPRFRGAEVGAG